MRDEQMMHSTIFAACKKLCVTGLPVIGS